VRLTPEGAVRAGIKVLRAGLALDAGSRTSGAGKSEILNLLVYDRRLTKVFF